MSEVVDYWKAMKEYRKEGRLDSLRKSQEEWTDFVEAAKAGGYTIQVMTEYHWNIHRNARAVAQYWPSTNKWQVIKTGKIRHGSREDFRKILKEGKL